MEYKMVQIPPDIAVAAKSMLGKAPSGATVAAEYLQGVVGQHAQGGWEFQRVDAIGVTSSPGCLAGLLGAKEVQTLYYVITFRRPS